MIDYSILLERIMESLNNYVEKGYPVGSFLRSVLSNDLLGAYRKADDEMLKLLPLLLHYIWWELPHNCHGSREIVDRWIKKEEK